MDIFSGGDDGDCGYRFEKGTQYIVFTQQEADGQLFATICNGTRPAIDGRALRPQLRAMRDGRNVASVFGELRRADPPFLGPPDPPVETPPDASPDAPPGAPPDAAYTKADVPADTSPDPPTLARQTLHRLRRQTLHRPRHELRNRNRLGRKRRNQPIRRWNRRMRTIPSLTLRSNCNRATTDFRLPPTRMAFILFTI